MNTTSFDIAISGPPPVATRHDHQGVIVTSIARPGPEIVAACRCLYTGLVLDHLGKHGCMAPDMNPSGVAPSAARPSRVWEKTGASAPWPPTSRSPATSSCLPGSASTPMSALASSQLAPERGGHLHDGLHRPRKAIHDSHRRFAGAGVCQAPRQRFNGGSLLQASSFLAIKPSQ